MAKDSKASRSKPRNGSTTFAFITTQRRGEMATIIIDMKAKDAVRFLRGVVRELYGLDGIGAALPDWDHMAVELLPGALPDGRPKEYDDEQMRRDYRQWRAARNGSGKQFNEYARRRMGAKTERQVNTAVQALRRALTKPTAFL